MIARATAPGKGGTLSCSLASSSAMSSGSRSRRVDSAWPNLTKIGPSSSSASRRRSARVSCERRWNQVQGEMKKTKRSGRYRCVARPSHPAHAAPVRVGSAISRRRTRSRIRASGTPVAAARAGRQPPSAIELFAQLIDAAQEMLGFGARHQIAAFVRQVLRRDSAPRSRRLSRVQSAAPRSPRMTTCAALRPISRANASSRSGISSRASSRNCCAISASPSMRTSPR